MAGQNGDFVSWFTSDQARAALAGAAGGVVRWVTLRERWQDGFASLIVGAICALYLGPVVEPLMKPVIGDIAPNGDSSGFASFVVGLGGISITGMIIDLIRARRVAARKRQDDDA
ncbi:hypothetical protein NX862_18785 [Rhodobacter sp. KR11]|uniref:hypothetical protein n=1 Tax=Rhodobacter sp. KR11 TaxID=2974588 RepID=UPI002221358B|nr:hypothetical protein [Rhodobacter sp. KR11]MCW1920810.1 hypothetical protein [Rhodobacter sp. KR11]